jgi:hypothetical protein
MTEPLQIRCALISERQAIDGRGDSLDGVESRLKRYARGRTWAEIMKNALEWSEPKRAEKIASCARLLQFRHYQDTDHRHLAGGFFCQQWKLCRICAIRRGAKVLSVLVPKIRQRFHEDTDKTLRAFLVTLTTKDGVDCKERFEHAQSSLRRYAQRARDHRRFSGPGVELNKAVGVFSSLEGGIGAGSGQWHWHFHQLWLSHERPSWHKLKAEWESVTGDSFVVHCVEMDFSKARDFSDEAMGKDLCEVAKYAVKPAEMTQEHALTVQRSTIHKHFTRTYGSLRFTAEETAAIEDVQDAEQAEHCQGPYTDTMYQWGHGRYSEIDMTTILPASMRDDESRTITMRLRDRWLQGERRTVIGKGNGLYESRGGRYPGRESDEGKRRGERLDRVRSSSTGRAFLWSLSIGSSEPILDKGGKIVDRPPDQPLATRPTRGERLQADPASDVDPFSDPLSTACEAIDQPPY